MSGRAPIFKVAAVLARNFLCESCVVLLAHGAFNISAAHRQISADRRRVDKRDGSLQGNPSGRQSQERYMRMLAANETDVIDLCNIHCPKRFVALVLLLLEASQLGIATSFVHRYDGATTDPL